MTLEQLLKLIKYVTGWEISFWKLMKISEKGVNLTRLFNTKHGYNKPYQVDGLPDRLFEPLENGAHEGEKIDRDELEKALKTYYQIRGWDDNGILTYGKFVELGIEELN